MRRALPLALVLLAACSSSETQPDDRSEVERVKRAAELARAVAEARELGGFHRPITTGSVEAQRLFDRGLVSVYAFNHADAIAYFSSAVEADPHCAMAFWGLAVAHGPHFNSPIMDEEHWRAAVDAADKAREHAGSHASPVERALIRAQWRRYTKQYTTDRRALDQAYALAMREAAGEFADDPDVLTLFAEALLQLHPWDQWNADGTPKHETEEVVKTLERALALQPTNPGANHLYIHAVEGSKDPGRASAAADRLRTLVPGAGHLLHMPSHIDARLGRWARASDTNELAVAADDRRAERVARTGFYRLYMAHSRHFLCYSAMMEGRFAVALDAARTMVARVPSEIVAAAGPDLDGYLPAALHVLVRFGRWEDVLKEPAPAEALLVSRAVWHYARGVSLAALSRLDDADKEAALLGKIVEEMDDRPIGNNKAKAVLPIPVKTLAAEIAFRRGKPDDALALLREAIPVEDALIYDEPPSWMHPVRHVLSAHLLALKKFEEAEKVLREDLEHLPEDGWALVGLVKCLRARGAKDEAESAEKRLKAVWARSDMKINSPCLCQPGE